MMKKTLFLVVTFLCFSLTFSQTKKKKTTYQKTSTYSNSLVWEFKKYQFTTNGVADASQNLYSKIIVPLNDSKIITIFFGNKKRTMERISSWEPLCTNCGNELDDIKNRKCEVLYGNERCILSFHSDVYQSDGKVHNSITLIDREGVHWFGNW